MGVWIYGGDQLLLEMPSKSDRCPPFPFLPSFAPQSPPVLPTGQTQPKSAALGVSRHQPPVKSPDWGKERINVKANGS